MAHHTPQRLVAATVASLALLVPSLAQAAKPSVANALKYNPIQAGIDYDIPEAAAIEGCSLELYNVGKVSGWEVRDADNNVLRRYLDTNADKQVDQWCYFKNGIEVYRDIDSDYNKNADQYRWLGTAGIRWAIDTDEDGRIDHWKAISPEEVSEEVVLALTTKNADRFKLLLLTPTELRDLGLGDEQGKQLAQKLAATARGYEEMLRKQDILKSDAQWVNFGGTRPGVVPAGTDGSQRDLHVYENVAAVVESGGNHNQVIIGTLLRAGDVWRLIDLPRSVSDAQASSAPEGFFFTANLRNPAADIPVTGGLSPEIQKLIGEMEQIDKDLATATTPDTLAPLNAKRADVLEQLAEVSKDDAERVIWIRQLADTVSAASQLGEYPQGIQRLNEVCDKLQQQKAATDLIAYVKYRCMSAEYTQSMQQPDPDYGQIQTQWLANLEQFVKDYASTPDACEAMLQLAITEEFAGNEDGAMKWYGQIVQQYPGTDSAAKANGAKRRIESVGQQLVLSGQDQNGRTVDIQSHRGKVVLIHYWSTTFRHCLPGLSVLKDMQAKYGKENVVLIGINVDSDRASLDAYLKENPLPWPQLYAPGGLDSPLANAYGIQVIPTMILADQEGKVVNRNLDAGQIDSELRRLLR